MSDAAKQHVFGRLGDITEIVEDPVEVRGPSFESDDPMGEVLASFESVGFQATNFGKAVKEIDKMREENVTIFLSYTSNMISSGVRETIKFLVKNKHVDVLCTTAGGIEEDFIKCLKPTFVGDFALKGAELRRKGVNRIGNLLIPNENYVLFEEWFGKVLGKLERDEAWTPSKLVERLGEEIDNEDSVYYWCAKNKIPVFSPALTDGSIGDMLYFNSYKDENFVLDIVGDIRKINDLAVRAEKTGMIILGGGLVKHHVCNANLMRNGADHAVFINTGQEFDGSDSGARPDEAVSWGKIKIDATPVKICADATLIFPLLVAATFARQTKSVEERRSTVEDESS